MPEPWWRRWPDRLAWEESQLAANGISFRRHEPMIADTVRFDLEYCLDGTTFELVTTFPDSYPYLRPIVVAATRDFRFHQNVVGKELCLLARDPALWTVDQSLASLIVGQLPKIVRANADDDEGAAAVEEHVPEPVGETYRYTRPDVVFIDSSWQVPRDIDAGTLRLVLARPGLPLRSAVQMVCADEGRAIASWDPRMAPAFPAGTLDARWVRIADPIVASTAADFADQLAALRPDLGERWQPMPDANGTHYDLVGVVFTDEVHYAETGDDWVFLLKLRKPRSRARQNGRTAPAPVVETFLVQAMRAGAADLGARVPALAFLADHRVAMFGLGALGAPSAIGFARAGIGSLSVDDPDHVEAGTTPRWPIGLTAAGVAKVLSVTSLIRLNWPFTEVVACEGWRIGSPEIGGETDGQVVDRMLDGASLIVDATANLGAGHYLADVAWGRGVPLVRVTATAGAWGGVVARFVPGLTGCEHCFLAALSDGTIGGPPADPNGSVTPIACSDTTFLGAGFDLTPLADEAVRMTVGTLSPGGPTDYPKPTWDVATFALRAVDGTPIPPTWKGYPLPPDPDCARCRP